MLLDEKCTNIEELDRIIYVQLVYTVFVLGMHIKYV